MMLQYGFENIFESLCHAYDYALMRYAENSILQSKFPSFNPLLLFQSIIHEKFR